MNEESHLAMVMRLKYLAGDSPMKQISFSEKKMKFFIHIYGVKCQE